VGLSQRIRIAKCPKAPRVARWFVNNGQNCSLKSRARTFGTRQRYICDNLARCCDGLCNTKTMRRAQFAAFILAVLAFAAVSLTLGTDGQEHRHSQLLRFFGLISSACRPTRGMIVALAFMTASAQSLSGRSVELCQRASRELHYMALDAHGPV